MNQYQVFPTSINYIPKGGSKALRVPLNFATGEIISLNTREIQSQGILENIQSIFCDNSQNTESLTIKIIETSQQYIIPAAMQAILPILIPSIATFNFISTGSTAVCFLTNTPTTPAVWNSEKTLFNFTTGGYLEVEDMAINYDINGYIKTDDVGLNANIPLLTLSGTGLEVVDTVLETNIPLLTLSGTGLEVVDSVVETNTTDIPTINSYTISNSSTDISSVNTAVATAVTVIPAVAAQIYRLLNLQIIVTSNASQTTAGIITLTFSDGATEILAIPIYIPATATTAPYNIININTGYTSATTDQALTATASAALLTGTFAIVCSYNSNSSI